MTDKLRLTPDDDFPEDLEVMTDNDVQVLDSRIQRQLDHEIVTTGESDPETEFRHYELDDEFTERGK
ncbi:hypothetical protein DC347_05525 [Pseudarthrobacter sp. AG30]|uniref:hypothetical protein n=1 Tax=Micrococcaceae TaxID=1268 RepID=UPI000372CD9B|nr:MULTISPECIES: hypothetical protein [Micrococcaceae]RAX18169.1 hypothetical protein DC347_05525 [Pseudarthrobacter sp. AG30]TDT80106.1 hypothetical protein DFO47_1044 [Arthrobacter sp. AG258]